MDRTRGGRSTYPFSYTLPASLTQMQNSNDSSLNTVKQEASSDTSPPSPRLSSNSIPALLQVRKDFLPSDFSFVIIAPNRD